MTIISIGYSRVIVIRKSFKDNYNMALVRKYYSNKITGSKLFKKKTSYRKPKFYQISIVLDLKFNICSNIFCCPTYSFVDHVLLYVIYERQFVFLLSKAS